MKYCIIWEEQGSETVIYGPFNNWQEAENYKAKMINDLEMDNEDDDPEDYGHSFSLANTIEVK